jgi:hypothetical protein
MDLREDSEVARRARPGKAKIDQGKYRPRFGSLDLPQPLRDLAMWDAFDSERDLNCRA